MNMLGTAMACAMALAPALASAQAPQWSDEQSSAWQAVATSWQMDQDGKLEWMDSQMLDAASSWDSHMPSPRAATDMRRWARFYDTRYDMQIHQLNPQSISIAGDTALVHYFWSAVFKHDDEEDNESGRCSDTLVRQGDGWKFLGWSCAEVKPR